MEERIDRFFEILDRVSTWGGALIAGAVAVGYVIPRLLP